MNLSEPSTAICPTLDGPVLLVLAGTTRPLSAREVARLCRRGSWAGVRKVLLRLTEHGIVAVQDAGNVTLYSLNRHHIACPVVERLADLREEFLRRLTRAVATWTIAPAHASLFGSAARWDGDLFSDIDVFIVRPETVAENDPQWRRQLDTLADDILRWTGNHAAMAEVGVRELPRLREHEVARAIRHEGIRLAGQAGAELFGGG